jgi:prevent-host-death family protein
MQVKLVIMTRSPPRTVSLAQTKSRLAEWIRAAESGETVLITRHGKPVAALVSADDLALLRRVRAASAGQGLAALAGGWADSDELVRLSRGHRRSSRRRAA